MRNILKIVFLFFIITAVSLGCIESQKSPAPNETKIATPEATTSTPEQKLPIYNETKPLKINDTFKTWSRGYYTKDTDNFSTYNKPYLKVITNYSEWVEFLDEQGYPSELEGTLFPGEGVKPETIEPADFNELFIIVAMMGYKTHLGPEIEIKNISRIDNVVNVTVEMYNPSAGATVLSAPYHIVIVKKELLPDRNSKFVLI